MTLIQHSSHLDLRNLAEIAREAASIMEDLDGAESNENYDSDERQEALETLEALLTICDEIGLDANREDWDTVGDELQHWGDSYEPTLIAESYWEDYCKEFCSDLGYLPDGLSDLIKDNINWEGVAEDLEGGYRDVTFDGETYKIREA